MFQGGGVEQIAKTNFLGNAETINP